MSASEDYLMLQVQALSIELHQTKNQLSRVQSEYEKERENCTHEELSDLRNEKNALNASLAHHRILVEKLSKENESLLKEVEDNKCHLDKLLQNVQDNDININRKVELIEAELLAKDECIKERERTIIKLEHDLEKSNAELSVACMNLEIEMQKFSDANQELKHLRREFCAANKSSKIDTDQMQQIEELKQLLASANAREEESRKIALATDEELGRKEKEYEKAVLYASECETAAKEWEQKYNHIVSRQSTSCHHDTEDILREMELLLEEKLELEKLLEQAASEEDSKLKSLEQELRKMYEEKQTEMLHEADSLMRGLKEDLALKEKELEKCKQDAQTTREKLILVEEQLKSDHTAAIDADEKVLQLSEQLSNAEETSSQLTKKLSNLQEEYEEFKRHVSSSRESYKQALEGKLINAKDEIASLKERLHEETSKARSYQEKADMFRKEISRIELEMSSTKESLLKEKEFALNKLKGDFAAAKVELSKANADIFTLHQDIEHYRETVNNLKQTSISREDFITYKHQMQQQEAAIKSRDEEIHKLKMSALGYKDEIKTLGHTLMDLESKLLSKDERIKNLEAKRLTKEHVSMIKKLKVSRTSVHQSSRSISLSHLFFSC
jgi:chromosome segregation ATPase